MPAILAACTRILRSSGAPGTGALGLESEVS
jgi:hypothetical protein